MDVAPGNRYADSQSGVQHEAAHAKFWTTGKLNSLDSADTRKHSEVAQPKVGAFQAGNAAKPQAGNSDINRSHS